MGIKNSPNDLAQTFLFSEVGEISSKIILYIFKNPFSFSWKPEHTWSLGLEHKDMNSVPCLPPAVFLAVLYFGGCVCVCWAVSAAALPLEEDVHSPT